ALHCGARITAVGGDDPAAVERALAELTEELQGILSQLPVADAQLLAHLFWEGCTETEVAWELGISQAAVSKPKSSALSKLRRLLCTDRCPFRPGSNPANARS